MRYKASIANWCLCVPPSIIVPHAFCLYMNLSMRTKHAVKLCCKQDVKRDV